MQRTFTLSKERVVSLIFKPGQKIYVYREKIDFRFGYERLSSFVYNNMEKRLVDGDLFIFLGRNRFLIKCLCFDGTGLVLIKKRIETGNFQSLETLLFEELTVGQLEIIFHGGSLRKKVFGKIPA